MKNSICLALIVLILTSPVLAHEENKTGEHHDNGAHDTNLPFWEADLLPLATAILIISTFFVISKVEGKPSEVGDVND